MILVIDIGNTNTVAGVFDGETLRCRWRLSTTAERTTDETGLMLMQFLSLHQVNPADISHVVLSSVVPPAVHAMETAVSRYLHLKPLLVGHHIRTDVNNLYENPNEVGADRIVNAVAALHLYGGPVIIIDFGTATTFDAVDENRNYLGGVICAGIQISMEALFSRAAKLPRVEIAKPARVIGRNTAESMQAGAVYGYAGQVDSIVERMKRELGAGAKVVATGGLAGLIAQQSKTILEVNPWLTLEGLRLIHEMNQVER